jgi:hypothetical protein
MASFRLDQWRRHHRGVCRGLKVVPQRMALNFVMAVPATGWTQACAHCGQLITDGQPDMEVESKWEDVNGASLLFRRVWHKPCHLESLEEGEEV